MEAWLTGTRAELDTAVAALTDLGHVIQQGKRWPMGGTDAGRYRLYLRLTVNAASRHRPTPDTHTGGALIDLTAARAQRRPA
ncbi:hypothetical protein SAMN05443287_11934 [Micromonospora phaseoli]|uniref:Uncharacterized protein n=1 Tax=Micromonospora phaseoli TaxID=1144548 RepID=A0A1H7E5A6_9ACTN|nr:hypothetical protein [Micromonospora phaseoli]PZV89946.1 hypothetical protein CLV64_11433 [Micromonospora phaseoli]GIJ81428.1 hypothetical protein Xph01_58600 [Micromonospora phaseoli]SEK05785.1 hypothetical protein SAMN05443287_11934 [Micromonospora phaseoli]